MPRKYFDVVIAPLTIKVKKPIIFMKINKSAAVRMSSSYLNLHDLR